MTTPGSTVKVTTKPTDKTTTTVPSVTAVDAKEDTPTLSEVTPKTVTEEITDIDVTGQEEGTKPSILKPSTELETSETLPADEPKAVVVDLGTSTDVPQEVTDLKDTLKDAELYEVPSTDGTKKVVVTFTTEPNKKYTEILPPTESDEPNKPTSQLFDVVVSSK